MKIPALQKKHYPPFNIFYFLSLSKKAYLILSPLKSFPVIINLILSLSLNVQLNSLEQKLSPAQK